MGISPVFLFTLIDNIAAPKQEMGKHAVAVTGYSIETQSKPIPDEDGFCLKSERIKKLYVHDDQIGPFARMEFEENEISWEGSDGKRKNGVCLSTSWGSDMRPQQSGSAKANPEVLLVPLYHKIRIEFKTIHDITRNFDALIELLRNRKVLELETSLEWDIFISTVNKLKKEIFNSAILTNKEYRTELLLGAFPRFLWRAIGRKDDKPVIEFIFDATDIEQGSVFCSKTQRKSEQ